MEDRYLFRGKRLDNSEWVYWDCLGRLLNDFNIKGGVFRKGVSVYTVNLFKERIDTNTIGQCTGLKDIHGKFIYAGDIVKWGHINCQERPIRIAEVAINPSIKFITKHQVFSYGNFIYERTEKYLEIIGNIYDNPDLLMKGEKEDGR